MSLCGKRKGMLHPDKRIANDINPSGPGGLRVVVQEEGRQDTDSGVSEEMMVRGKG